MEKTMRRTMETMKNPGADLSDDAGRQATALRAGRRWADRVCSPNLRMSLGAIPTLSFMPLAQIENARKDETTGLS
jgi:hypothetical protein